MSLRCAGLQRITLKIHIDSDESNQYGRPWPQFKSAAPLNESLLDEHGLPTTEIMTALLDTFMKHFGCQFPGLDRRRLGSSDKGSNGFGVVDELYSGDSVQVGPRKAALQNFRRYCRNQRAPVTD